MLKFCRLLLVMKSDFAVPLIHFLTRHWSTPANASSSTLFLYDSPHCSSIHIIFPKTNKHLNRYLPFDEMPWPVSSWICMFWLGHCEVIGRFLWVQLSDELKSLILTKNSDIFHPQHPLESVCWIIWLFWNPSMFLRHPVVCLLNRNEVKGKARVRRTMIQVKRQITCPEEENGLKFIVTVRN